MCGSIFESRFSFRFVYDIWFLFRTFINLRYLKDLECGLPAVEVVAPTFALIHSGEVFTFVSEIIHVGLFGLIVRRKKHGKSDKRSGVSSSSMTGIRNWTRARRTPTSGSQSEKKKFGHRFRGVSGDILLSGRLPTTPAHSTCEICSVTPACFGGEEGGLKRENGFRFYGDDVRQSSGRCGLQST